MGTVISFLFTPSSQVPIPQLLAAQQPTQGLHPKIQPVSRPADHPEELETGEAPGAKDAGHSVSAQGQG